MSQQRPRPDVFSSSAAMSACEVAGQWLTASNLLRFMSRNHLEANDICKSACISACRLDKQWEIAAMYLKEIVLKDDISISAAIGASNSEWPLSLSLASLCSTEFTLGAAIGACAKASRRKSAKNESRFAERNR